MAIEAVWFSPVPSSFGHYWISSLLHPILLIHSDQWIFRTACGLNIHEGPHVSKTTKLIPVYLLPWRQLTHCRDHKLIFSAERFLLPRKLRRDSICRRFTFRLLLCVWMLPNRSFRHRNGGRSLHMFAIDSSPPQVFHEVWRSIWGGLVIEVLILLLQLFCLMGSNFLVVAVLIDW